MGCDIHFQIERRIKNQKKPISYYQLHDKTFHPLYTEQTGWTAVTDVDNMSLTRDYDMFAYMADVRSYFDREENLKPKGLPDDCTDYTKRRISLFCCKNNYYSSLIPEHQFISQEEFDDLLNTYNKPIQLNHERFDSDNIKGCLNPDFHSFTWLTYKEYKQCFKSAFVKSINGKRQMVECYMSYYVLLKLLKAYEMNGLYEVRLIIWFDN